VKSGKSVSGNVFKEYWQNKENVLY
jgi:hypothetical protein